ncbi:GumC family protein [Sphingomonas cavernae]|uniref:non-specific protein-tyrosine kinase n=1 Tax=Sphingomonas cavernae TaxID=2320861 RepID=A0A418WQW6_9SPHN|nr:GNVR domain-containing protein [Sphingomonas cavernae]RJF93638.1 hypothetical protein D3876_04835 [Sphingomonas cavernae]
MTDGKIVRIVEPQALRGVAVSEPWRPNSKSEAAYVGMIEIWRIMMRHRSLLIGAILGVLALTVLMLALTKPIYTSSAVVMVQPEKEVADVQAATVVATPDEELRISTRMELLQSRALARRVVRNADLVEDPEFASAPERGLSLMQRIGLQPAPPKLEDSTLLAEMSAKDVNAAAEKARLEEVTDRLMGRTAVTRLGRSHLIDVAVNSDDPYKASHLANRIVQTHIESQRSEERNSRKRAIADLTQRVGDLRAKLESEDSAVAGYMRANNLFAARPEEINNSLLTRIAGALSEAKAASALTGSRASGVASASSTIASSPVLNELKGQEATLAAKAADLSSFYGPGHPDLAKVTAQLSDVRGRIVEETARATIASTRTAAIDSRADAARMGALAGDLGALRASNSREMGQVVNLKELQREADTSHQLYLSLLTQLKELMAKPEEARPDMRIISTAPVPTLPSHPEPKRTLAVALIGGAILGIILALVAENVDNRLRTATQVERALGLPTLAMVPNVFGPKALFAPHSLIAERPGSVFPEALRNLYIELLARVGKTGSMVVVVTSPLVNEGKTTVAAGLAAAASALGHRAVSVDVDLRQPGTAHVPGDEAETPDMVAYLSNRAGLDEVLVPDARLGHFVQIGVNHSVADASALISSPRLEEMVRQLRERFDLIVLDAPPILPVLDAKILSGIADATILVLDWGRSHPEAARVAVDIFGDDITGVVLNRVDYGEHARRSYGDAIHYYARYQEYYRSDGGAVVPKNGFKSVLGRLPGAASLTGAVRRIFGRDAD